MPYAWGWCGRERLGGQREVDRLHRTVGILLFDDVEVLDFSGPFEVFFAARLEGQDDDDPALFDVVTIAQEIGRRGIVREGVHDLLGRPGGHGMVGHVEVQDAPAIVGEHDEDEEDAEPSGGHREEIEGDQVGHGW